MSSSFGTWYSKEGNHDLEAAGGTPSSSGDSSGGYFGDSLISLLPDAPEGMPSFSLEGMRQNMEASMPKKVLGMGYQQRFKVFCALLLLSALFFALAFFVGLPMLAVRPQKFALSFTCGSLTFMGSFAILKGPQEHMQAMCAADRLLFTSIYVGSMMLTLYLTFTKGGLKGYTFVLAASGIQLVALLWYLISFLPGGSTGLAIVLRAMCTMLQPILAGCARLQARCMASIISYWARG